MRLAALLAAAGCAAAYRGGARPLEPAALAREPGWVAVASVPELRQGRELDCGPTATAMVLGFWGRPSSPDDLRVESGTPTSSGVQAGTLRELVRARGLEAYLVEGTFDDLERELGSGRPVLVGLAKPYTNGIYAHYEVVVGLNRSRQTVATLDPGTGWSQNSFNGFQNEWRPTHHLMLVISPPAEDDDHPDGPTGLTLHLHAHGPRTVGPAHGQP
jgi:ABC-type bacteriocin/lantibiotic exporter with double-glycine peptidase domain